MPAASPNRSFNPISLCGTFLFALRLVHSQPLGNWKSKSVKDSTLPLGNPGLLSRSDESYSQKAEVWCNDNPSECKAVVSTFGTVCLTLSDHTAMSLFADCDRYLRLIGTLSIFGLFLIIFFLFKCYRRRRRRQAAAKDSLEQTEAKAAQDALEQRVEERFFHRQREMKLRHDMEMLGLSNDKGK